MTRRLGGRRPPVSVQRRLTVREDEIRARAPLLQASMQMDIGEAGERGGKPSRWWWEVCPPLRTFPDNPVALDLRGLRYGRLAVIGLLDDRTFNRKSDKARWVVRCACGLFEVRSAKAIRNPANAHDACWRCGYVHHLRRQEHFARTGRWPTNEQVAM